jgi:hypothetical protein
MTKSLETIASEIGSLNIDSFKSFNSNFARSLKIVSELNKNGFTSDSVETVETMIDGPTPAPAPTPAPTPAPETGTVGCTGLEALGAIQFQTFWNTTAVAPELDALGNL